MIKYRFYKILRFFHLISHKKFQKKTAKYTPDYKAVARSKYFDAAWYLEQNPDVLYAGLDPVEHYVKTGWKQSRHCTPYFNAEKYLNMYPEVAKQNINPLAHWERFGRKKNYVAETLQPKRLRRWYQRIVKIFTYPVHIYIQHRILKAEFKNYE